MLISVLLIVISFFLCGLHCSTVNPIVPEVQVSALNDLYVSTNGANWQWDDVEINGPKWNFDTRDVNPCVPLWQGLECNCSTSYCNVTSISLGTYNLHGPIPITLTNLTELRNLQLQYNYIQGIPSFIGQFSNLEFLDLSYNRLNGTIPEGIGQLRNLQYLILRLNNLTGTMPASMSNLINLFEIDLDHNVITGQLTQFTSIKSLQVLALELNYLTGSIPASITNLTKLLQLKLRGNYLTGTITEDLFSISTINVLDLSINYFNGTIPYNISKLVEMQILDLSNNLLSGTIPSVFGTMSTHFLNQLFLEHNQLTGTLPPLLIDQPESLLDSLDVSQNLLSGSLAAMNMRLLVFSEWSLNSLTGSIPDTICDCTILAAIYFNQNELEGSLPACMGSLKYIEILHLNENLLTGPYPETTVESIFISNFYLNQNFFTSTIPSSICMNKLQALDMGQNLLSGSVPECLGNTKALFSLNVSFNSMDGTLPLSLRNLTLSSTLALNDNHFSGPLPDISEMKDLVFFYAQNNQFTGSLQPLVLNASAKSLSFVDVSNNQLTGPLLAELFPSDLPLFSFAAAVNCLSGTIPTELCGLPLLLFLDLDGVCTAQSCRRRIFPKSKVLTSFVLKNEIEGSIPTCLFNMPTLNTLHVSGNSIRGSLPGDLTVSSSLQELSLSHNVLSGSIPSSIQQHPWSVLDLSYNKLNGDLSSSISLDPNNASLVLQVNRISGNIPSSLISLDSINILTGNLFECGFKRSSLPSHDQGYRTFQCGSDTFNQASIIWICFAAVAVVLIAVFRNFWRSSLLESYRSSYLQLIIYVRAVSHEVDCFEFKRFVLQFQKFVVGFTAVLLVLFLPLYAGLKIKYYTVLHQYAWTVSAAFLSGVTPAVLLCVLYIVIIFALFLLWRKHRISDNKPSERHSRVESLRQTCSLVTVVLINAVVMSIVNGGFVYIILNFSTAVIFLAQVCIALFKLSWNEYAVRGLMQLSRQIHSWFLRTTSDDEINIEEQNALEMPYMTLIVLFNSIIAPCLATAAVDPNCFLNVFVAPPTVTTLFPDVDCSIVTIEECTETSSFETFLRISYDPPFIYSYQCSSSILTNYASVYVFMYLMVAFLKPVTVWLMIRFYREVPKGSCLHVLVDNTMSKLLKPAKEVYLEKGKVLFHKERFILRAVSKIAVLLTFGVVFPPIAFVLCIAFMVESYLNLVMMGRFLVNIEGNEMLRKQFQDKLSHDSEHCVDLLLSPLAKLVVPFASIFYAFFVLDIYGDAVGFRRAVWAPLLLLCTPVLIGVVHITTQKCCKVLGQSEITDNKDTKEMVEVEMLESTVSAFQKNLA